MLHCSHKTLDLNHILHGSYKRFCFLRLTTAKSQTWICINLVCMNFKFAKKGNWLNIVRATNNLEYNLLWCHIRSGHKCMDPLWYFYAKKRYTNLKIHIEVQAIYMKGVPLMGYRIKPYDFFILKCNDKKNNCECILVHTVFL